MRGHTKTWFFLGSFFLAMTLSISATFYRIFFANDYLISYRASCDPKISSCFARQVCDTEDGVCSGGDEAVKIEYYTLKQRGADDISRACFLGVSTGENIDPYCIDPACSADERVCSETFCSPDVVPDGESCLGPEDPPSN